MATKAEDGDSATFARRRNARVVGRVVRDESSGGEVKIEYEYFKDKHDANSAVTSSITLTFETKEDPTAEKRRGSSRRYTPYNSTHVFRSNSTTSSDSVVTEENADADCDSNEKIRNHLKDFITKKAEDTTASTYFLGHEHDATEASTMEERVLTPTEILLAKQQDLVLSSSYDSNALTDDVDTSESETSSLGREDSLILRRGTTIDTYHSGRKINSPMIPSIPKLNRVPTDNDLRSQSLSPRKSPNTPPNNSPPSPSITSTTPTTPTSPSSASDPNSPRVSLLKRIFTTLNIGQRTESELRYELRKYDKKLNNMVKESRNLIKQYKAKQLSITQNYHPEMLYLRKCALIHIIPTFRWLFLVKNFRYECRIKLEKKVKQHIKERILIVKNVLTSPRVPDYIDSDFLSKDTHESMWSMHPSLSLQSRYIKKLEKRDQILTLKYQELRKTYNASQKKKSTKDQGSTLKNLLSQVHIHPCEYHLRLYPNYCNKYRRENDDCMFQEMTQYELLNCLCNDSMEHVHLNFCCLLSDERGQEEQDVRRLLQELDRVGWDIVPAREVSNFVVTFSEYMARNHRVTDQVDCEKLHFLNHHFFYGCLMGSKLSRVDDETHQVDNYKFYKQARLLKHLTPQQLGVSSKFLPIHKKETNTFEEPCRVLSLLGLCSTPNDMLHCVYTCAKQIHVLAAENCARRNKEISFGADEFIPIMIYVAVHSELYMIHSNLGYMSKYAGEVSGEVMYFLTCLEGAVMYVCNITDEELQQLIHDPRSTSIKE